jgi:hypothetical protein
VWFSWRKQRANRRKNHWKIYIVKKILGKLSYERSDEVMLDEHKLEPLIDKLAFPQWSYLYGFFLRPLITYVQPDKVDCNLSLVFRWRRNQED